MFGIFPRFDIEPLPPTELHPGDELNARYHESINYVMDVVSDELPALVGMTVFGSLSRGEAVVKEDGSVSDIDGIVVMEAKNNRLISDVDELLAFPGWATSYPQLNLSPLGMDVKVGVGKLIDQVAGTGAQSDIEILLVEDSLLSEKPKKLLMDAREPETTVTDWNEIDAKANNALKYFFGRTGVAGLFFPVAYGNVDKYRATVLQTLAEVKEARPQLTSRAWFIIRYYVNHFQKRREAEEFAIDLPETLSEAIEHYKA